MNSHQTIYITAPEYNNSGQIIFRENVEPMVLHKHVVVLIASATTGKTIQQSIDGISYYGGIVEGVSALFSAVDNVGGVDVDSIFTTSDISDYATYRPGSCPFCDQKQKLDAIVNSFGYSKI